MPLFSYQAAYGDGSRVRSSEEAASADALTRELERRGLFVVEIKKGTDHPPRQPSFYSRKDVLEATRSLAALLEAGLPVRSALVGAQQVISTGQVADALNGVIRRVERGDSLGDSLSAHAQLFDPIYVGVVRAGERSGDLSGSFSRLTSKLERDQDLRARLVSASVYPILLSFVGVAAVAVLLLFVIPRFVDLLADAGAALPRATSALLWFSARLRDTWPLILSLLILLPFFSMWIFRSEPGRIFVARLGNALPLIRSLRSDVLAARFARVVGVLIGGGAPLTEALRQVPGALSDPLARDEAQRVKERVRQGSSLNSALADSQLFPPMLAQLVAVGEKSGQLETFLLKAADIFEARTERLLQRLVTVVEPAVIIVFGGVIALVALALLQAIYGVNAGAFR